MDKRIILVVFSVLFVATMASGAVVYYYSNQAEANVSINSPMSVQMALEDIDTEYDFVPVTIPEIFGGETATVFVRTDNWSSRDISGFSYNLITNPMGITCADFESVEVTTDGDTTDIMFLCDEKDPNTVSFSFPADWEAHSTVKSKVDITFVPNATGAYTLACQATITP